MVLQGPGEDVVTQVEDQEADDEQGAHAGPHGLPVPVQRAAGHGLKVTFKSAWKMGRERPNYPCYQGTGAVQLTHPFA